jgi:three-Cys-motif partner protein
VSKKTGKFVPGSPENALHVKPPFREYHFIDLVKEKVKSLERLAGSRSDVKVYHGDCNQVLLQEVYPRAKYEDYRRALCVVDPYGLHIDWEIIYTAGKMKSVEIFLNFPVFDMNLNVLWHKPEEVLPGQVERMNRFWGDESWRTIAYIPSRQKNLFGQKEEQKAPIERVVEAYRERLKQVAGFQYVPRPIAMRNTQNAVLYYLFFASQKPVAKNIVKDIFDKYRDRKES